MLKPSALMVRQLLLASGVTDPEILQVVSRVMDGGLAAPRISHIAGAEGVCVPIPKGASCVVAAMDSPKERIEVFMVVHQKV